jgi:putative membrane protein
MMMGFGFIGFVLMLLFWILLIAGAVWLVRSIFPGSNKTDISQGDQPSEPREILDHRYARGEITREQYKVMLEDIVEQRNR